MIPARSTLGRAQRGKEAEDECACTGEERVRRRRRSNRATCRDRPGIGEADAMCAVAQQEIDAARSQQSPAPRRGATARGSRRRASRRIRPRLAPSATRAAISPRRLTPRTRTRFDTLAQTISRSSAPITLSSTDRRQHVGLRAKRRAPHRNDGRTLTHSPGRLLGIELRREKVGLRAAAVDRRVRPEASESPEHRRFAAAPSRSSPRSCACIITGRNRSILRLTIEPWKSRLGDADDRERIGVDLNGLADDRRVGRERAPPQAIRDHDDRMLAGRDDRRTAGACGQGSRATPSTEK